jgi:predicted glycosyltransferase
MKILFGVSHPAHVHLFKNAIWQLMQRGHEPKIIAMKKEITLQLLDAYNFKYEVFGKNVNGLVNKLINVARLDRNLYRIIKGFNPDMLISTGSPYLAQVGRLLAKPHIAFGDTEIDRMGNHFTVPFCAAICVGTSFQKKFEPKKEVRYNGYHELAYLHPNYFTPNASILSQFGLAQNEKIILTRFIGWSAVHDIGARGFGFKSTIEMLEFLKKIERYGRVFLTTEIRLPKEFEKYLLKIPSHKLHDMLAFSSLYVGEGATMASEAGVLGVPWIFVSSTKRGYLEDQERNYALGWRVKSAEDALKKAEYLLSMDTAEIRREWQKKREKQLSEKIDVTAFMVGFIENWKARMSDRKIREPIWKGVLRTSP